MSANASYIEELLRRAPQLKPSYDQHVRDNDTLLPHVFMGDVARFVIAEVENPQSRASVRSLLDCFESGLTTGSDEIKELIVISFVENLIGETSALKALTPMM